MNRLLGDDRTVQGEHSWRNYNTGGIFLEDSPPHPLVAMYVEASNHQLKPLLKSQPNSPHLCFNLPGNLQCISNIKIGSKLYHWMIKGSFQSFKFLISAIKSYKKLFTCYFTCSLTSIPLKRLLSDQLDSISYKEITLPSALSETPKPFHLCNYLKPFITHSISLPVNSDSPICRHWSPLWFGISFQI